MSFKTLKVDQNMEIAPAAYLGISTGARPAPWGQGCCAATVLTEGGYNYPMIRQHTYNESCKPRTAPCGRRGLRPMHLTTFTLTNVSQSPQETFYTTHKQFHSGRNNLEKPGRVLPFPSQHRGHVNLLGSSRGSTFPCDTSHYACTHNSKPVIPANRLHLSSVASKFAQTSGSNMKEVITTETQTPSYWSQYSRIHNNLGKMLGPGQSRPYAIRQSYNILTGEHIGPAWKEDNKTLTAGRILARKQLLESG